MIDEHLDVCAVTETWLSNSAREHVTKGELTPVGYKLKSKSVRIGKRGGVAVLYKSTLKCKKQKTESFSSFELLKLLLSKTNKAIYVCVLYHPPAGSKHYKPVSTFIDKFQQYKDT